MLQINYFIYDVKRLIGKYKLRVFIVWLNPVFWGVLVYRLERSLYLKFKRFYKYFRLPLIPFVNMVRTLTNVDINYKANIKGGLLILHPSVGIVISGKVKVGSNLLLTGGNVIGFRNKIGSPAFRIGNNCSFGANATLMGPLTLADDVIIGASACVIEDCLEKGVTLIGVPAKKLTRNKPINNKK